MILHKNERKGWNKWIYIITISSGIPQKKPKQAIIMQLTKINKSEFKLGFTSTFHNSI